MSEPEDDGSFVYVIAVWLMLGVALIGCIAVVLVSRQP